MMKTFCIVSSVGTPSGHSLLLTLHHLSVICQNSWPFSVKALLNEIVKTYSKAHMHIGEPVLAQFKTPLSQAK